jgi:hypothetical protein
VLHARKAIEPSAPSFGYCKIVVLLNRLYDWLEGRDFLVVRADRKPLLVVVTLDFAAEIVAMAERAKGTAP